MVRKRQLSAVRMGDTSRDFSAHTIGLIWPLLRLRWTQRSAELSDALVFIRAGIGSVPKRLSDRQGDLSKRSEQDARSLLSLPELMQDLLMLVCSKKSPKSLREVVDDFVSFRHNFGDLFFQRRNIARKRLDEVPGNSAQRLFRYRGASPENGRHGRVIARGHRHDELKQTFQLLTLQNADAYRARDLLVWGHSGGMIRRHAVTA